MDSSKGQIIEVIGRLISERVKGIEPGTSLFNVVTVMPFGSGAGNVISKVETPADCLRIAFNSQGSDLARIEKSMDVIVPCGEPPYKGSAHDPELGKEHIESVIKLIPEAIGEVCRAREITEPDCIITIHSLGYGFGTGSFKPVITQLKKDFPKTVLLPLAITPFNIEKAAFDRAYRAMEDASKITTIFVISNETAAKKISKGLSSEDKLQDMLTLPKSKVYEKINFVIKGTIDGLIKSLTSTEPPLQSMDSSDLRSIINGPLGTMGWTPISKYEDLTMETIAEAEKNEFLSLHSTEKLPNTLKPRATYVVDAPGSISLAQEKMLSEYLEGKYGVDPAHIKPLQISRHEGGTGHLILIKSGFIQGKRKEDICGYYPLSIKK